MFKFIHAADIHLDSPLKGLEQYPGAPVEEIRGASRRALSNLVELALAENVQFMVIAGDVYDGDWNDYNTGLFFVSQMNRLREQEIPVYFISGNHDAKSKMTRELRLPDNVRRLSTDQPETVKLSHCDVLIHGQGFAHQSVSDNLAAAYPAATRGCFNLGLLHTSVTGHADHHPYAPCSLDDLRSREYDYWALGHVHEQKDLHTADGPPIVFPGNLQGRHIREPGARGCALVTVDDRGNLTRMAVPLDVVRWQTCEINASGAATEDDVLKLCETAVQTAARAADGRMLAVRVVVRGPCKAHHALFKRPEETMHAIRSIAGAAADVWVEKVKLRTTSPVDTALSMDADGPLEELRTLFADLQSDETAAQGLAEEFADVLKKLPAELRGDGNDLVSAGERWGDPAWLRSALEEVQPMLLGRLLGQSDGLESGGESR